LRDTINWLVEHYDTDARIGRRMHHNKIDVSNGAANGDKNGTPSFVEKEEPIEVE